MYTFGDIHRDPVTGERTTPAQQLRNTIERVKLADELGLDWFGIGEHHRTDYSISAPATVLAAAATVTERIRLGSAVTVLSTEDPVRVYQQFATIDLLSGGRAELTAGRGSFIESFPLFGATLNDYDALYEEKLALLLEIDRNERVTWSGHFRPALSDAQILPRPLNDHLDIWVATGGNPASSARAGKLGLPVNYAIIGGLPERFAPLVDHYRKHAAQAGHDVAALKVAVSGFGFVADDKTKAKSTFLPYWLDSMRTISAERGFPTPTPLAFENETSARGALFVGGPNDIADRIIALHGHLQHDRQAFQMDLSGMPQREVLRSIELLATEVKPQVDRELGAAVAA
ncbi:LLM class flavin-dependent oxidoreductase [Plantibacter sp. YIM 135249]|uniref:LLM class flavin-dependent oxidoreductase n=1 Tax=Plantibacter sp. YIM 135249 TaxID=3423918 RepID=UPI003D3403DA